jgi:hypothetical protein
MLSAARVPAKPDQRKSKHPENLFFTMQLQGALFHTFFLESCCGIKMTLSL